MKIGNSHNLLKKKKKKKKDYYDDCIIMRKGRLCAQKDRGN